MSWFQAFRNHYGFTYYGENRTSVGEDKPLIIIAYVCALVSISALVATLGIRGRERWYYAIRASYALGVGSVILVCLFAHGWQEGSLQINSPYIYKSSLRFRGLLGINVALHGTNVTLLGNYDGHSGPVFYAETYKFSEMGSNTEGLSYYLIRGLPIPILKVIAFLTVDDGDFRWGRSLQKSGYFTEVLLWTSLAFWIVSNLLLCSVVIYGAYMFTLTGVTMILACITYHVCQSSLPLLVRFGDDYLTMSYSWCFWVTLTIGCVTLLLGLLLIIADHTLHQAVAEFFQLEKLAEEDLPEQHENPNSTTTRSGTVSPPPERYSNSVFMNTSKRADQSKNKRRNGLIPGHPSLVLGSSDGGGSTSWINQAFSDDEPDDSSNPGPEDSELAATSPPSDRRAQSIFVDTCKRQPRPPRNNRRNGLIPGHPSISPSSAEASGGFSQWVLSPEVTQEQLYQSLSPKKLQTDPLDWDDEYRQRNVFLEKYLPNGSESSDSEILETPAARMNKHLRSSYRPRSTSESGTSAIILSKKRNKTPTKATEDVIIPPDSAQSREISEITIDIHDDGETWDAVSTSGSFRQNCEDSSPTSLDTDVQILPNYHRSSVLDSVRERNFNNLLLRVNPFVLANRDGVNQTVGNGSLDSGIEAIDDRARDFDNEGLSPRRQRRGDNHNLNTQRAAIIGHKS